jgi:tetratricopeptide (TPR) repeat protein
MLGEFGGENFDLFARLLDTGADLILEGNIKRGIRYFEKALVLDPTNAALAFFIGEHFFRFNKPVLSRAYLERAIDQQANNHLAMLMLGVICGDEGDLELAKRHLTRALKIEKNSFTAHYGLGRILVSEGRLREAIAHLRRALALKPTPEMYYLVGRAYLEDDRTEVAVRHLRRCVELDANGLAPLPVFGRSAVSNRKVLTSGDVRLTELVRSDLLNTHSPAYEARKGQKRG